MYKNYAAKYYEQGMVVFPIQGKIPRIKGWQNTTRELSERYIDDPVMSGWGISLLCGQASGVIGFDIDTDDPKLLETINQFIPKSLSAKRGSKGETRFFRWNSGIKTKHSIKGLFDVLSDGSQTVLPPSIHPTTEKPYIWIGESLCDVGIADLPDIRQEDIDKLIASVQQEPSSGGRNNYLATLVWAKLHEGVPLEQLAREVYQQDQAKHVVPFLTDMSPGHENLGTPGERLKRLIEHSVEKLQREEGMDYAHYMGLKGSTQASKGSASETLEVEYFEPEPIDANAPPLGKIIEDLTHFFNSGISSNQKQASQVVAIHLLGAIVGNGAFMNWLDMKTYCNFYAMLLLPSTCYKTRYFDATKSLLQSLKLDKRLAGSGINSTAGLFQAFKGGVMDQVLLLDECHSMLADMTNMNGHSAKLAGLISSLYTQPGGIYYSDRTAQDGARRDLMSPYLSILAATQPSSMDTYIDPFFQQGLLGRFIFGIDDELQIEDNILLVSENFKSDLLIHLENIKKATEFLPQYRPKCIPIDHDAHNMLMDIQMHFQHEKIRKRHVERTAVIGRAAHLTSKLSLLLALSEFWDGRRHVSVSREHVESAFKWTTWHTAMCRRFKEPFLPDTRGIVLEEIRRRGKQGISYQQIIRIPRMRISHRSFTDAITSLNKEGYILVEGEYGSSHYYALKV